jgi:hypothetical protein
VQPLNVLNPPKRGVFLGLRGVLEPRRASTSLCAARLEALGRWCLPGVSPGVTVRGERAAMQSRAVGLGKVPLSKIRGRFRGLT